MIKVIKRDGRKKSFDPERIISAVSKAEREVTGTLTYLGESVVDEVIKFISNKNIKEIDIEEIQDLVVKYLKDKDEKIAKAYESYREKRNIKRNENSELIKSIRGLVDYSNEEVLTENSNKQSYLASTQRDLIAGEVSKYIAKTEMIPKHLIEAHNKGIIKIHDLDYFLQPIYNCELINLKDMLQNGTVINKKKIHKPRSLRTAMTLTTQIAAQVASCTYGK